LVWEKEVRK
jgi:hypothetical protein